MVRATLFGGCPSGGRFGTRGLRLEMFMFLAWLRYSCFYFEDCYAEEEFEEADAEEGFYVY